MGQPQPGILPEPNEHARFVILRIGREHSAAAASAAASIAGFLSNVAALDTSAALVANVGFGSGLWDVISPGKRPVHLRSFEAFAERGRSAPSTGGDLLFHVISKRADLNAELVLRLMPQLSNIATVLEDVQGFRYLDSRDLTGFIDGTENPTGNERADVAIIGEEDPQFAGGSYVFTQRYVHDLERWQEVTVAEQEKTIGRRKPDSEELPDDLKPPTAHISRVAMEEDDEELEIVRHSFPYATATEAGLFFIAYTKDLTIPERMLSRMMGTAGDDLHDHLMDYTRAVSGATFFAPSVEMLRSLRS